MARAATAEQRLTDAQLVSYRDRLTKVINDYNKAYKLYNEDAEQFNRLSNLRIDPSNSTSVKLRYTLDQREKIGAMRNDMHAAIEALHSGLNVYSDVLGEQSIHDARGFIAAYEEAVNIFVLSARRGLDVDIRNKTTDYQGDDLPYFQRGEEADARAQAQLSLVRAALNSLNNSFTNLLRSRNIPQTPPSVLQGLIR